MPAGGGFEAVGFFGIWHLIIFAGLVPWAAWRSRNRLATGPLPPKKRYYAAVIGQQVVLTGIAVGVVAALGIPLFAAYRPTLVDIAGSLTMLAAAVLGLRPAWRQQAASGDRRVELIAPIDGADHLMWVVISALAAVGEEVAYRGVLYWVLFQLTGSMAASVAIAAAVFGVGHLVQGWRAVGVVTVFAVAFHVLVIATGSLYPAMVVHFLYDLIAGVSYGRYARAFARSNSFMKSTSATTLD